MNKLAKAFLIAGVSSIMLCTTAFAADNGMVSANNSNVLAGAAQQAKVITVASNEASVTQGVVFVDVLNVRSGPSTDYAKIGKLTYGSTVEIITSTGGWYQIKFGSGTAYVSGDYVSIKSSAVSRGGVYRNSANDVVSYAINYLGTPYVSGGSSPSGFDCSGFTKYVFGHFGYSLSHSSGDQYSAGTRVAKSELIIGDLVFFTPSAGSSHISHVGIYVGNGNFIHSPIPGQSVKIDSLSTGYFASCYYGATRIIK